MENKIEDDGSLACLNIDVAAETRQFNCAIVAQQKIVNTTFYVLDIIDKVKTKHGDDRMLVKIKTKLEQPDSEALKFFTNSNEIKLVLEKVKNMDKLPRKVTLRGIGNKYFLE
jgi:hypothetical protein